MGRAMSAALLLSGREKPEKQGFLTHGTGPRCGTDSPDVEKPSIYGVFCDGTRFILREMP
jgi:hypothetical protein